MVISSQRAVKMSFTQLGAAFFLHSFPPESEARGCGREELPHAPTPEAKGGREEQPQGAVAAWAQEGLEEPSHVEGQEGWQ